MTPPNDPRQQPAPSPYPPQVPPGSPAGQGPYRAGPLFPSPFPPPANQPSPSGPPYPSPFAPPVNQPVYPGNTFQPPGNAGAQWGPPGTGVARRSVKLRAPRVVVVLVMLAVVGAGAFVVSHRSQTSDSGAVAAAQQRAREIASAQAGGAVGAAASSSQAPAPAGGSGSGSPLPVQDKDWRLDSTAFAADASGDFGGKVTLTYLGAGSPSQVGVGDISVFDIYVFASGKQVGVAHVATVAGDALKAGQNTFDVISIDPFVPGPYTYRLDVR